jgi:hypothetical protein
MRPEILLFLFVISIFQLSAQDSSFNLKDYKYRTPGYQALSIDIGLSGGLSKNENTNNGNQKNRTLSFAPGFINYFHTISTDKRLHTSNVHFQPYLSFYKSERTSSNAKQNNYQHVFTWNRNDKFYKKGNKYFEIGNELSNEIVNLKVRDAQSNRKDKFFDIENTVVLGIGKGRIESVQDAQMALFILNDLQEQGLISSPNAQTVNDFAKLITQLNNRRIFDNRRKRIFELTQIDSFIKEKNLAAETHIKHFTIINDNWALAFNPIRFSGTNLFLRLLPSAGLGYSKSNVEYFNTTIFNSKIDNKFISLSPQIGVERFVPINLKWQKDMGAKVSIGRYWLDRTNEEETNNSFLKNNLKQQISHATINAFYGFGFYPNNRTLLNTNINLNTSYLNYKTGELKDEIFLSATANLIANYFISYRSRLLAYVNLNYTRSSQENFSSVKTKFNSFNTNFSLSFSHIIF